jgi:hypothetical protein
MYLRNHVQKDPATLPASSPIVTDDKSTRYEANHSSPYTDDIQTAWSRYIPGLGRLLLNKSYF